MNKKELFIVEGKSAKSAVKASIDNKTQSVYAIQGKLANVRKKSHEAVAANLECTALITKLGGCFESEYVIDQLPYSRVLVLMDPDIDGAHSTALLLSFFALYCPPIVEQGLLSIIKPPTYRVATADGAPNYAWTQEELQQLLDSGDIGQAKRTTRFKGVAQFSTQECHQLLTHPTTRQQHLISDN